jgi:Cu+-exporting ATPase
VRDDLRDVVRAIVLGRATLRKVRQNLVLAFAYNVAAIPVAMGALYPAWGVLLRPEMAGLAMALSSVSVVTNALLLKRVEATLSK